MSEETAVAEVEETAEDEDPDVNPHELPPHLKDLPKEFFTDKLGRPFVLFIGLIHILHEKAKALGADLSIINTPVKLPTKEDTEAIFMCHIKITMPDGRILFEVTEFGDANGQNVNNTVGKHLIRMAVTRATGRAARIITDVGLTLADEVGSGAANLPGRSRPTGEQPPQSRINRQPADAVAVEQRSGPPDEPPVSKASDFLTDDHGEPILVKGEKVFRAVLVKAMRLRIEEMVAAKIPFRRVGEHEDLKLIAKFCQEAKEKIEAVRQPKGGVA